MLRQIYLSPLGRIISAGMNALAFLHKPFMAYGYNDKPSGQFRKRTRISSNAIIGDRDKVAVADNVWIWHHSIIDGSNRVTIEEGAQIGGWVGIFSHGSQVSVRLLGRSFIDVPKDERAGYTRGAVHIGSYSFIGAGAMILPGTVLGKGCLVAAGSIVSGKFEDFSLIKGNPAKRIGDVRSLDKKYLRDEAVQHSYFDSDTVTAFRNGSLAQLLSGEARAGE
jgi:acetyltransferase-like isoleucine patch superfamily enzyme